MRRGDLHGGRTKASRSAATSRRSERGLWLAANGHAVDHLYASPFVRAQETAAGDRTGAAVSQLQDRRRTARTVLRLPARTAPPAPSARVSRRVGSRAGTTAHPTEKPSAKSPNAPAPPSPASPNAHPEETLVDREPRRHHGCPPRLPGGNLRRRRPTLTANAGGYTDPPPRARPSVGAELEPFRVGKREAKGTGALSPKAEPSRCRHAGRVRASAGPPPWRAQRSGVAAAKSTKTRWRSQPSLVREPPGTRPGARSEAEPSRSQPSCVGLRARS